MIKTAYTSALRRLPLVLIILSAILGALLLRDRLTLEALADNRAALLAFRDQHYLLAVLGFIVAYTAIVGLSLPGATLATLTGGFLFGTFPGVAYNVSAATLGAAGIFLAARAGLGAEVAARITERGGPAARLQAALSDNQWSALLTMRLVPAVPFFLANLLPAFAGIRFWPFFITTFTGIIPGGLVFTSIGAGLGEVLARGDSPDLSVAFSAPVLLPLLGLAALAALPMLLRALRPSKGDAQ